MHRLLKRQITKILKKNPEELPPEYQRLFQDISEAYQNYDNEQRLLERVQSLNAEEINRHKERERELAIAHSKLALLESFTRFVPKEFLHFLSKKDIQDIALGDAVQSEMTILFTDIRSFTSLSEKMSVEDNFKFLNAYLSRMGPIITQHHGFIDKFIGDAIMALFPPGAAQNAVRAAISMRQALQKYNSSRLQKGYLPIDTGIGINTGLVMLGTLGSQERLSTTVIGDAVNLAARLESLTKSVGSNIIITEFLFNQLPNPDEFCLRRVGVVKVLGKEQPVNIYEVFDADPPESLEGKKNNRPLFEEALNYYLATDYTKARETFARCVEACPQDLVAAKYIDRCTKILGLLSAAAQEIALTQQK
ncbi:MAG: adenylate/guanylate cyclase domain-containing protein [Methylacidiphilales bacterium]|nr:adenylate/guanylate cyclase domain-containing protein [Candidatus Methylacidiphilales bacterium]MDW8349047.1 adenylate/guanylate cyclase domain-containing protein [Verrucomicrobiae bacterium]